MSWTPYALVSFYTCFIDENGISPLASTVPAFFSKSSIIWTTLFFITTNQNIRSKFMFCSKPPNNTDQSRKKENFSIFLKENTM